MEFRWQVVALFVLCSCCCTSAFIPILHEVVTSFQSLGDAIAGNPQAARNRWHQYAEESVFGSGIYSAVTAISGDVDRATEIARGMGRATGKAIAGGGFFKDVPGLHELATAGESLGDIIGGGDTESARQRWESYVNSSLLGSGAVAVVKLVSGDEGAGEYGKAALVAGAKFAVSLASFATGVGVNVATGGLGTAAAVVIGGVAGGAVSATSTVVNQALSGEEINAGDVIGRGLFGATVSGVIKYASSRSAPATGAGAALARSETEAVLSRSSSADLSDLIGPGSPARHGVGLPPQAVAGTVAAEADALSAASTPRNFRTAESTPRSVASSGASGLRHAGEPMADIVRTASGAIDVDLTGGGVFQPQGEVVRIPFSLLVGGRDALDPHRLDVCRHGYSKGIKYPPIKVAPRGDGLFSIVDGHHRVAALMERGRDKINAIVVAARA